MCEVVPSPALFPWQPYGVSDLENNFSHFKLEGVIFLLTTTVDGLGLTKSTAKTEAVAGFQKIKQIGAFIQKVSTQSLTIVIYAVLTKKIL